jgi:arylformamidase
VRRFYRMPPRRVKSDRLLGLAYGEQPRERLDLFLAGNPTAPTLAYIHGVYWQMTQQTKELYSALAEGAVLHGLNVAIVEYTLAPEARIDRIVGEVRHAISWLHEHLGDYGADPGRIYVAGHSAGGHLTAMTMPLGAVRGGIAISGLYDLEPIRLNYLNEKLRLDQAEAQRNSPMFNYPPMAGPLIVTYGTANCPNYAASRSTTPRRGSSADCRGICCRSTGPTISRSSKHWPSQTAN